MKSLLSILLPLVGMILIFVVLGALQAAGERMQKGERAFIRRSGKALTVTATILLGAVSIAGVIGVGYLLLQPGSLEPTACARFCD